MCRGLGVWARKDSSPALYAKEPRGRAESEMRRMECRSSEGVETKDDEGEGEAEGCGWWS